MHCVLRDEWHFLKLGRNSTEKAEDGEEENLTGTGHVKRKSHVRAIIMMEGP